MKKTEDRNVLQEYRRVRDELARKHPTPEAIHRDLLSLDDDKGYVVIRGRASVKRKQNRKKPTSDTLPVRRKKEVQ